MKCVGRIRLTHDIPVWKGHKERARRFGVAYEPITRLEVLDWDQWICQLCDQTIPRDAVYPQSEYGSVDHIVPMSLGGSHTFGNVQAAHLGCNIAKGNHPKPPQNQ